MFCEKCNNFMDITNIISKNDDNTTIMLDEDEESSNFDISETVADTTGKYDLSIDKLNDILEGNTIDVEVTNELYQAVEKTPQFKKLDQNKQTLILNRLYERLVKKNKKPANNNRTFKESYFYCKNCGFNKKIPDGTFIYSKNIENNEDKYNTNFQDYYNDPTIPISKKYVCVNDKCETHKNPGIKSAAFYRFNNTFKIRYLCGVCKAFWFNG